MAHVKATDDLHLPTCSTAQVSSNSTHQQLWWLILLAVPTWEEGGEGVASFLVLCLHQILLLPSPSWLAPPHRPALYTQEAPEPGSPASGLFLLTPCDLFWSMTLSAIYMLRTPKSPSLAQTFP